jgi:predicted dienelactone hydrolase
MRCFVPAAARLVLVLALAIALPETPALAGDAPSDFGADAPQLAQLGEFAVGTRSLHLIEHDQLDVLAYDAASGTAPRRDRVLDVDLWYPGLPSAGAARAVYTGSFPSDPPAPPARFSEPGIAVRDAPAAGGGYPLIIVSHGYSNDPAAMSWITENLASKGYVVAAIHHDDPPITDSSRYAGPMLRRPLDLVFVAAALRKTLGARRLIDPSRIALLGYSQGGYGVLTAAGATLDPDGRAARLVPGGLLLPYARGGAQQGAVLVPGLRAVVAISPAGGGTPTVWGPTGMLGIHVPLLLIAGDADRRVGYATAARAFFDTATNARRFLLTFKGAGHAIGLGPAPEGMRRQLYDLDWFEDPVWRKERLNAIEAHFITAFFGRYVKGDDSFAPYLDVPVTDSSTGVWPATTPPTAYDAYSPGGPEISVWKGFQRKHAEGLELLQAPPAPAPAPPPPAR